MKDEYSEAATQVLDILNYTRKEDIKKIPQSFIKFLNDISDKNYTPKFNHEQPINGLNLKKQAKELLGFIYITWWSDESERKKYKDLIHSNSLKKEKKETFDFKENYDFNNIFKNKVEKSADINTKNSNVEQASIVEYKENNWLKKS